MSVTSHEVWDSNEDRIVHAATEVDRELRPKSIWLRAGGEAVFATVSQAAAGTDERGGFVVLWLGPWDTKGSIELSRELIPVWRSSER